ncbi:hypothetical protein NECAME_08998, partial [Necator americanus]
FSDSPAAPGLVRQLGLSGIANGATATSFCSNASSVSGGGTAGLTVVLPQSSRFSTSSLLHSLQSPASSTFTSSGHRQTATNRYATSSHLPHFDRPPYSYVAPHGQFLRSSKTMIDVLAPIRPNAADGAAANLPSTASSSAIGIRYRRMSSSHFSRRRVQQVLLLLAPPLIPPPRLKTFKERSYRKRGTTTKFAPVVLVVAKAGIVQRNFL